LGAEPRRPTTVAAAATLTWGLLKLRIFFLWRKLDMMSETVLPACFGTSVSLVGTRLSGKILLHTWKQVYKFSHNSEKTWVICSTKFTVTPHHTRCFMGKQPDISIFQGRWSIIVWLVANGVLRCFNPGKDCMFSW
jgi:hypothetical protein